MWQILPIRKNWILKPYSLNILCVRYECGHSMIHEHHLIDYDMDRTREKTIAFTKLMSAKNKKKKLALSCVVLFWNSSIIGWL